MSSNTVAAAEPAEAEPQPRIVYNLWSNKHQAWWRPDARGYTEDQAEAGLYTEAEAVGYVVQSSHSGLLSQVTCMVAAPINWMGGAS